MLNDLINIIHYVWFQTRFSFFAMQRFECSPTRGPVQPLQKNALCSHLTFMENSSAQKVSHTMRPGCLTQNTEADCIFFFHDYIVYWIVLLVLAFARFLCIAMRKAF